MNKKSYLLKRSPDFTKNGVIVKRNEENTLYTESRINGTPLSQKLCVEDELFVAESDYGIYARGIVTKKSDIIQFSSLSEIMNYYTSRRLNDEPYWFSLIERLFEAQKGNKNAVLSFQEYSVNLSLLDQVVHLTGYLGHLKKVQSSLSQISKDLVHLINNPRPEEAIELSTKIPNSLRFDLFSLFSKEYKVSHWIDIDHFVPQSIGGPGNIIENLVPVSFSLNRYKSDSIPKGLFEHAKTLRETQDYVSKDILEEKSDFLRSQKAKDSAVKIVNIVNNFQAIERTKVFYKAVLNYHHPEYVNILNTAYPRDHKPLV